VMTTQTKEATIPPALADGIARLERVIVKARRKADRLAAEGTEESRMKARTIRCRATKDENYISWLLE
jgi:hypothetical protein